MAENNNKVDKVLFEDYETKPVPESKTGHWYSQAMIWAGIAFCLIAFSIGGMLGTSMDFKSLVTAVLFGTAVLALVGSLIGVVGAKLHLTATVTARFGLGTYGAKIFGLVIAASNFGWFGYQCHYFGGAAVNIVQMFGGKGWTVTGWSIVGGLLMCITAIIGFKGIKWLSNIGVPLLFIMVFVAFFIGIKNVPMSEVSASFASHAGMMTIPAAVTTVIGSFVTASCYVPDISRYSKRPKDAVIGCWLGFCVCYSAILILGAYFANAFQTSDLSDLFINKVHLGLFAGIVLIIATWSTNDNNLYSSVLGISNAIGTNKVPRWLLTAIFGVLATIVGALGLVDYFVGFLSILGVFIPPFGAAIIGDYWIFNRKSGLYAFENADKMPMFRLIPCIATLAGIVCGLLATYSRFAAGITSYIGTSIFSMIVTLAVLIVLSAVTKKGVYKPAAQ